MTAWGNIELAVEAMRAGAQSFVQKPWDNAELVQVLQREVERGRGVREQSERHRREEREGLLIQRALLPAALPSTDAFRRCRRVAAGERLRRRLLRRVYVRADDARSVDRRRGRQGTAGGAADVEPAGGGARVRARIVAAARDLRQRQSAAVRSDDRRPLRDVLLRAARAEPRDDRATPTPVTIRRCSRVPTARIERLTAGGTVLGVFPDARLSNRRNVALRSRRSPAALHRRHHRSAQRRRRGVRRRSPGGRTARASPASMRRRCIERCSTE